MNDWLHTLRKTKSRLIVWLGFKILERCGWKIDCTLGNTKIEWISLWFRSILWYVEEWLIAHMGIQTMTTLFGLVSVSILIDVDEWLIALHTLGKGFKFKEMWMNDWLHTWKYKYKELMHFLVCVLDLFEEMWMIDWLHTWEYKKLAHYLLWLDFLFFLTFYSCPSRTFPTR